VVVIFVLEQRWGVHYEEDKLVLYEKIDLIKPENHELLLDDLRLRTGLNVKRFKVEEIDFLRDTARLTIYYDNEGA